MAKPKSERQIKKDKRRTNLPVSESYRRLDRFEIEARGGVPDEELARLAEVAPSVVRKWRAKRKIQRELGRPPLQQKATRAAMNLIGTPMEDVLMRTRESPVLGKWKPPEYVVRVELNYDKLVWQVYALRHILGVSVDEIAEAHGYTYQTVEQALLIADRWLSEKGTPCKSCGRLIDPSRELGCGGTCLKS